MSSLKNKLRSSIRQETRSVKDRFTQADNLMNKYPAGLANPPVQETTLGAQTERNTNSDDSTLGAQSNHIPNSGTHHSEVSTDALIARVEEAKKGQIITVPIEKVRDNPYNARHVYNTETIHALVSSILAHGQIVPALATDDPENENGYILIDGGYRKRALERAGIKSIKLTVMDVASPIELYRFSYLLNNERQPQSAIDNALAWKKLLEEDRVANLEEIATLTGKSIATVSQTLSILNLPENVKSLIRENSAKFTSSISYELYLCRESMPNEDQFYSFAKRILDEDMSSRDIRAERRRISRTANRKKKDVSRQYKIMTSNRQTGYIKEWDSGKIAFEITLSDPHERAKLMEELKSRFLTSRE